MKNQFHNTFKWLYPGIGIKRWVGLTAFGVALLVLGTGYLSTDAFWAMKSLDAVIVVSGIIILILGIKMMIRSYIAVFMPSSKEETLVDIFYQKKHLSRGPKIVTIGGGTGLSVLLRGLKEYTSNISAIVTVADSGGSSGRLRQQFHILPPGDIRNCLVALADAPTLMRDLFQYRFDTKGDFHGHSFGNLFITVMTRLTGDFEKAIKETSKVLALRGQVIPATLTNVTLSARHTDGTMTCGEDNIPKANKPIAKVILEPQKPLATPDAIRAIKDAQIIILGPGSLYTSVIPNLLIKEICDALVTSSATKVYVCNVMTQPGETDGYSASDHINALISHGAPRMLDYCVVNTGEIPQDVLERYQQEKSFPVANDRKKIEAMGYRVIEDEFGVVEDGVIRHSPEKLARIILGFIEEI